MHAGGWVVKILQSVDSILLTYLVAGLFFAVLALSVVGAYAILKGDCL